MKEEIVKDRNWVGQYQPRNTLKTLGLQNGNHWNNHRNNQIRTFHDNNA